MFMVRLAKSVWILISPFVKTRQIGGVRRVLMRDNAIRSFIFLFVAVVPAFSIAAEGDLGAGEYKFDWEVGTQVRLFAEDASYGQSRSDISVRAQAEFYYQWNDGMDSIEFIPWFVIDKEDAERTHGDIQDLAWIHVGDDWELRTGIRKVFWGVTESRHLVDVINQTDGVEDFDGEDKLGQQMINLSLVKDWGIIDIFVLPGFRERTFVESASRLRGEYLVDNDDISYQSSAKDNHVDLALRWAHTIGDFDIGSYWFHGTNRDPILSPTFEEDNIVLKQYYNQMDQFGIDVQATIDDWLYKVETIVRHTDEDNFWAIQAGFEYTYIGIFESNADLGLLLEYGWDSRGETSETKQGAQNQNDLFFGSRIAFNDAQSSEMLMGFGADLDHNAVSFILEANRRFGDNIKVSVDVRFMQSSNKYDALYSIKEDDHIQFGVEWYF